MIITYLRKPKIAGIAIFDTLLVFIIAIIIVYTIPYNKDKSVGNKWIQIIVLFLIGIIIGIVVHKIIGIPTMLNYYLGLNTLSDVMNSRK